MAVATGERRIVSVLVADVAGSTAIGEKLGPERSKFLIDEVMRIMMEQVRRFEGTVAQLVGDELLAFFGAPVAHEDDSERAVRAALAIQRALAQYAHDVRAAYGVDLSVRIGVHTGPVVVGVQRDGDDSYDPWNALGDTVNVASRLQEIAGEGGVVIGPTTKRQVETCFELEELGERELKGVSGPVETFRVTRLLESEPAPPSLPLVGREFEVTVLERTMDALVDGRGAIVSVMGEPGIGKTRLVWEVRERYRERVRFIEARGVSYARTFPYWPIRDLLREWLGVGASTPEARVRLELKAELAHIFGHEEAEEAYPFFASLLGLALEPEAAQAIRELNRESIQTRTFEVFFEFVCKLAEERPVCLVFEDLHWADDATLELLESILGVTEESAVALFFLYRSERELGSWRLGELARQRYPHRYREVEVRPLPADSSRALVGNAAEGEIPDSVAELLAERSGGNPFFLEEAFRDLVERGALRRDNGSWQLAVGEDELAVPALVQGALQARLDRLDPGARDVLSVAAVIGRTFGLPLLEKLASREQLIPALTELQRLDLIVEKRRRPNPEYRFRHGLVQEVAYASLVETKRRKLHRRVGEALEEIYRESPEETYGLLARHFSEADAPEKAVEYLLKAGDAARAVYADREALEHYKKARVFLARIGDERRSRDTLFKMALAYHLAFDFENAEEMYDEAFSCKAEEPPRPQPTERIETSMHRPSEIAPDEVYSTEGGQIVEHLFRGLLLVDRELNVVPAMADNMRVSSDGLTYLFRLREGARWSDGEPLTAEDFAFAWRSMREEQSRTAFLMEDVESAEALDDRTLEVRLREPRSYFPYVLTSPWAYPWPRHRCEVLGKDWRAPENLVGNGPFVIAEWGEESARLVASPHWIGPRGNVREIHVTFTAKGEHELDAWREGRYDVLRTPRAGAETAPETLAQVIPELSLQYIGFKATSGPFANEHVRKAFSAGLDRERLVAASGSLQRAATKGGAIPPAMPGHSHRVGVEYDPERARALLAEAGYPEGRGLPELTLGAPKSTVIDAFFLAEEWEKLGARVRVARTAGHDPPDMADCDFWLSGWTADYPDPEGFFHGLFRSDWPFYRDEDIDELLAAARTLGDQGERLRLYHEIDRLWVAEHAGILPLAYGRAMLLRRPWVEGLWASPLSRAHLDEVVVGDRTASAVPVPDEPEALEGQERIDPFDRL
ncbi:MAG TPA: ABC transporter substrate-binding protein [Gaiellaceae bacterium]|nr:ABC transporter substrate-binding protein [Gaiellaceae bacterium]